MTFVNDSGEVLEVDEESVITKQGVSFADFSVKGDYSVNFKVPNNSVTRRVLNYEGPQMTSQIAYTRQPFTLMRDGNPFIRGSILIQSDDDYLDCFFVSGNSNWIQSLQGIITELDWTSYAKKISDSTITSDVSNTEGVIFPYIDFTSNLKSGFHIRAAGGEYLNGPIVDVTNDPVLTPIFDWYPCLYISSLVKEILQQNGLKLSGNIVNDPIYKSMIVTPYNGKMKRDVVNNVILYGSSQTITFTGETYKNYSTITDPDAIVDVSNGRITPRQPQAIIVTLSIISCSSLPNSVTIRQFNSSGSSVNTYSVPFTAVPYSYQNIPISMASGDYITVTVQTAVAPMTISINLTVATPEVIQPGDYVTPAHFLYPFKGIDIIKWVIFEFWCTVDFEEASQTLSLNIIEKLKKEDSYDFSGYYVRHKSDFASKFAAKNFQRLETSSDNYLYAYNAQHDIKFGEGVLETDIEVTDKYDLFKSPFVAAYTGISKGGCWQTNIPLVNFVDDGDPIPFSASSASGTPPTITLTVAQDFTVNEVIRITTSTGDDLGYFYVISGTTPTLQVYGDYNGGGSGFIRKQRVDYKTVKPSVLINLPNIPTTYFEDTSNGLHTDNTNGVLVYNGSTVSALTTSHFAFFCKQKISKNIDGLNLNLAFDNPDDPSYVDASFNSLYSLRVNEMFNNPLITAWFLLPEAEFQRFTFSRFIYLSTETLDGYFFVTSINNYKDGNTPVEFKMFML